MNSYDKALAVIESLKERHASEITEAEAQIAARRAQAEEAEEAYSQAVEAGQPDDTCLERMHKARLAKDRIAVAEKQLEALRAAQAEEVASLEAGLPEAAKEAIAEAAPGIAEAIAAARGAKTAYMAALANMHAAVDAACAVRRAETTRNRSAALPVVPSFDAHEFEGIECPRSPNQLGF